MALHPSRIPSCTLLQVSKNILRKVQMMEDASAAGEVGGPEPWESETWTYKEVPVIRMGHPVKDTARFIEEIKETYLLT